jgi:FkbM family methyltransferase
MSITIASTQTDPPYGTYRPDSKTWLIRLLTRLGLAHGKLALKLRECWLEKHGPWVDAEVGGLRYRLNLHDNTTDVKILISSKVYDAPEIKALTAACRAKAFVDIGANIGYYTLSILHSGCPRAIAIEPNPPTLARLRYNVGLNAMQDRADIVAMGAGPEGELEFYQTGGLGGSSFVKPDAEAPVIKVRTKPLLSIFHERGVTAVGGMKIDVEGFEDQVLNAFFDEAPPALLPDVLVMESCHAADWKTDLDAKLASAGYRLSSRTRSNIIYRKS